jgi:molybdenum cofactor biosynthesis protein B
VVTVSDTRTEATDKSGHLICQFLENDGHTVNAYAIVKDEPDLIRDHLRKLAADAVCEVVLLSGGTGLAPRDTTFEAVEGLLEKRLTGFGELFRSLSYAEIGPAAMLSRATAGVFGNLLVFSMPGSVNAVRLAMEKLVLPEIGHAAALLRTT